MGGFWAKHQNTGGTFFDKARMVEDSTPFDVKDVAWRQGEKYGDQWVLTVEVAENDMYRIGAEHPIGQIGFPTGFRDALMKDIASEIAENGPLRCQLTSFETNKGNPGYAIGPVAAEQLEVPF